MSIKTWQERLAKITSTSYQGYASQEEIDACKQAELDEIRAELARRTGERDALKSLVASVHKARGRYHSQLAMCALYDACGLPNVKPISGQKEFGEKHD